MNVLLNDLFGLVVILGAIATVGFVPAYCFTTVKDVVDAKAEAIAKINRAFWVEEYYRHVAIDNTNTSLELAATEEKELVKVLFEDAITEERLLTDVEMKMVREIIVNCPYFGGVKAALTVFDNYAKVTVNDRVKLETQEACNWIIFNLTAGRIK